MATFVVTAPDGKEYEIDAPEGATQEQALNYFKSNWTPAPAKKEMSWGEVAGKAATNLIPSTIGMVKGVAEAIASPIETAKGLIDIGAGAAQNILPKGVVDYINTKFPSESAEEARMKVDAVGKFYADRYGSQEGFKKALAKDPAGVLADAATVLSGGSGLARTVGAQGVGQALNTASRAVDPLRQAVRGAEAAARPIGRGVASVLGGIGTHTGGESIQRMAQAGFTGGRQAEVAAGQMRGTMPVTDLLDEARGAFDNLRAQRGAEYVRNMQQVTGNPQVIPFGAIDQAVTDALNVKRFKGVSTSPTTQGVQEEILKIVDDWKQLNPTEYHTPSGLDALKQSIGDLRDATQFGTPSRKVADTVYGAVKNEIVKQAPEYANAMKQYAEASETISEIQRHLLGGDKASAVTAMRKLQNMMSAGGKNKDLERALLTELEQAGAGNLAAGLAGLSMQDLVPRMLSGRLGAGIGTAIVAANNPVVAAGLLPLQSPRLIGEAALAAGRGAGAFSRLTNKARQTTSGMLGDMPYDLYAYQANLLNQQGNKGMLSGEK